MLNVRCNMVWRSISVLVAQKQLAACRKQLASSSQECCTPSKLQIEIKKKIVALKCIKMFLFEKIDKNFKFKFMFLGNSWNFYLCPLKAECFFSEGWKCYPSEAVSSLKFFALEMHERKAYRRPTGSNVSVPLNKASALEHDQFKQVSLYTSSWLFANT